MEIEEYIYDAHRRLSFCSFQFLEYVKNHPASLKRTNFNNILCDQGFDNLHFQPWPTFVNQETKKELSEAAVTVANLIKSVPGRLFDYDPVKISCYYGFSEDEAKWMLYGVDDNYIKHLLGRGDFLLSPSAGVKCIEFNIQASLGGWELDFMEPLYIGNPVLSHYLKKYNVRLCKNTFFSKLLEHIGAHALETFGCDPNKEINWGIIFPEYKESEYQYDKRFSQIAKYHHLWKTKFAGKGEMIFSNLDHMQVVDDHLMCGDKTIAILIEIYMGKLPFMIMDMVKKKRLLTYNGPIGLLLSHKLNLALLSEYRSSNLFTPEEKEVIRKYIPWTRKIIPGFTTYGSTRIKLDQFIISNRERLVMKPGTGYGGYEVFVGFGTPPDQWKKQLEQAILGKNWVVQEYIPSFPYLYQVREEECTPHQAVWGLFVLGSQYAGGTVRILPEKKNKGVINSSQGAEISIIIEVEE